MNAPSVNLGFGGTIAVGLLALAAGVGLYLYTKREKIVAAVNPLADTNLAYKAAGAVTEAITGGQESTLGGALAWLREKVSGDEARIEAMLKGAQPAQASALPVPSAYVAEARAPRPATLADAWAHLDREHREAYGGDAPRGEIQQAQAADWLVRNPTIPGF